MRDIRNC